MLSVSCCGRYVILFEVVMNLDVGVSLLVISCSSVDLFVLLCLMRLVCLELNVLDIVLMVVVLFG